MATGEQPDSAPPARQKGARFSLATLLSAIIIGGLVAHAIVANRQLDELKAENNRLRVQAGLKLDISDPDALHILRHHQKDFEGQWKWRLYVPGPRHVLKCSLPGTVIGDISIPLECKSFKLPMGEFELEATFTDTGTGKGSLLLSIGGQSYRIDGYDPDLLTRSTWSSNFERQTRIIYLHGSPEYLIFVRKSVLSPNGEPDVRDPRPMPGLSIWIEDVRNN
jgi:hypothetical protein